LGKLVYLGAKRGSRGGERNEKKWKVIPLVDWMGGKSTSIERGGKLGEKNSGRGGERKREVLKNPGANWKVSPKGTGGASALFKRFRWSFKLQHRTFWSLKRSSPVGSEGRRAPGVHVSLCRETVTSWVSGKRRTDWVNRK